MEAVTFDGCFGWLHRAPGSTGVVLCAPFGYDGLCTYRGMRRLAERLAGHGTPVLRFDYPGTGDSAGDAAEPMRWRAWIDSIKQAAAFLRSHTGVERVTLCGLRLGATLAALAAQELGDVEGLVLLAPVLSGKNYVRELRAHYQTWLSIPAAMDCEREPDTDAFVEAFGFRLYRDSIDALLAVDLLRDAPRPAARVLVLDSLDASRVAALCAHYGEQGIEVERQAFDEYSKFMLESLDSELPQQAFQRIEQWIAGEHAVIVDGEVRSYAAEGVRIAQAGFVETPVWIDDGRMFGIYCAPQGSEPAISGAPCVLMLNTGAVSRIGNARLAVRFARRLAGEGVASLRLDRGALGDSEPSVDAVSLDDLYSEAACEDAACAARWVKSQGHSGAVLLGICAGAFTGLYAAVREPAVIGAVLVNLQKFTWQNICGADGKPTVDVARFGTTQTYFRSMRQLGKWVRFLRGQTGGLPIAREVAARLAARARATAADWGERTLGIRFAANGVRHMLGELDARRVETRLLYGAMDTGIEELERYFGPRGRRVGRFSHVRVAFRDRTDHAILSFRAQENVMSYFEEFYRVNFGDARRTETSTAGKAAQASVLCDIAPVSTSSEFGRSYP
jgi:pimeloyl-ACP methyl ester carboxylesterase